MKILLVSLCSCCFGVGLLAFYYSQKLKRQSESLRQLTLENALLKKTAELSKNQEQLMETFSLRLAASSQAMIREIKEETQNYFSEKSQTLESILTPMQTTLSSFKQNLANFESKHAEDRGELKTQILHLLEVEKKLEKETQTLTGILKHPGARGRWGEIQLERILELSGMLKYCDYETQMSDGTGAVRADLIIRLPQERCLVIDAKAPLPEAYLTNDSSPTDLIVRLKDHIKILKTKSYWEKFDKSPEFVILFLPGESLFNDAIRTAPELIDIAASSNVILSSPLTLLALLKTVAHMWKQENVQKQILEIGALGKELHQRMHTLFGHIHRTGKNLSSAVQSYNDMTSSLQRRVLPTLRKFEALEISSHQITVPAWVQTPTPPPFSDD